MTTTLKTINEAALGLLDAAREQHGATLADWRAASAAEDSSPTYVIGQLAERAFLAEGMIRWFAAADYALGPKGDGLESLLEELERRHLDWEPTNSTCLLRRLQGDVELTALKRAQELIRRVLKAQADGKRPCSCGGWFHADGSAKHKTDCKHA